MTGLYPKVTPYATLPLSIRSMVPCLGRFYSPGSSFLLSGTSACYIFPPEVEKEALNSLSAFRFTRFKGQQKKCICSCIMGNNMLLISSTGSGKSLCYQLPALVGRWTGSGFVHGVTVVISPLISLINDQVSSLKAKKISAVSFSVPNATRSVIPSAFSDILSNKPSIKFIYMTPERFCNPEITHRLKEIHERGKFLRLVVDECHCITMWGHEFRSHYMQLGNVLQQISPGRKIPILAVTASATAVESFEIRKSLKIDDAPMIVGSFYRDNLKYIVKRKSHNNKKLVATEVSKLCEQFQDGSGIVYCISQKLSEDMASLLRKEGITAVAYHAGLTPLVRSSAQQDWMDGHAKVVCATVALGMGVDKPDVRFVVHASISMSLAHYYQETGRAGRDGKMSLCLLLYDTFEYDIARQLLQKNATSVKQQHRSVEGLDTMVAYAELRVVCRRQFLVKHFGEVIDPGTCQMSESSCDNCDRLRSDELLKVDMTHFAKMCASTVGHGLHISGGIPKLRIKSLVSVLQGKQKNVPDEFLTCRAFGCFKQDKEEHLIMAVRTLITSGVLRQFLYRAKFSSDICQCFLKLSDMCADILNGKHRVAIVCTRSDLPTMPMGSQVTNVLVLDSQLCPEQRRLRMAIMSNSLCKQLLKAKLISVHDVTNLCVLLPLSVTEVTYLCRNKLPTTAYHTLIELFKLQAKEHFDKMVHSACSATDVSEPYEGIIVLQNAADLMP